VRANKLGFFSLLLLLMLSLSLLCTGGHAFSYPKSSKVAMVPDEWSWTLTDFDGGGLYVGTDWPNDDSFTFTNVAVENIKNGNIANPLIGYDTVMLWATRFKFGEAWNNTVFSSRILSFISDGGKLIIYTSEIDSANRENAEAFSNFIYPFIIDSPGHTASQNGSITNLENDTLSSNNPVDESYINLSAITSETDAIGDATVMVSYDSNWYIDLYAINMHGVGGPVHAYAFYGAGLIIFNGIDIDDTTIPRNSKTTPIATPSNNNGRGALEMIWWRELSSQNLGASQNVNGLTLNPSYAVNPVNTTHTVTATARNIHNNSVIANVSVNFNITAGPNMGLSGQATTDANGQATFSWYGSVVGTDTLSATIPNSNPSDPNITSTATKTWVIYGPLSVSVAPSLWVMDIGQTKLFTATPNGGSLNYTSYQWYVNGSAQSNQIMPTFIFTPVSVGSYLITATVTDNLNTTSPQSNATIVTVNASPTVSITPVGPLTMDAGQKQTFTANPSGGSGTIHYQWYVNAEKVGNDTSIYTYTASGSSAKVNCEITDSASIQVTSPLSNTVIITVNSTPTSNSTPTETIASTPQETPPQTPAETPPPTPIEPAAPEQPRQPTKFFFNIGWVEIAIIIFMLVILAAALRYARKV
jgi:hypothetical protein